MAFGQSSGPPATGKQLKELLELLEAAGHSDFRDARGPMGFTQRQAGGKFSRDEADLFIEQLQVEVYGDGPPPGSTPPATNRSVSRTPAVRKRAAPNSKIARRTTQNETPAKGSWRSNLPNAEPKEKKEVPDDLDEVSVELDEVPAEQLAAELRRRGWTVTEPPTP